MAVNLIRNARVFVLTGAAAAVANAAAYVGATFAGINAADTYEVQVLNGITFSQTTNTQNITLNEAGPVPTRGQRAFNTALNAADFSFSTYMRPEVNTGLVSAAEKSLWNALLSPNVIPTAMATTPPGIAYTAGTGILTVTAASGITNALPIGTYVSITGFKGTNLDFNGVIQLTAISSGTLLTGKYLNKPSSTFAAPTYADVKLYNGPGWAAGVGVTNTAASCATIATLGTDVHQLQNIALMIVADSEAYIFKNAALDQATIDFGVDAISIVAWTGKSTQIITSNVTPGLSTLGTSVTTGTATLLGYTSVNLGANWIQNKLSTTTLISNIGGVAGTSYTLPLTGGTISINNNLNYKIPENLGVVNLPIGYTTGTRAISGNFTAYLRTGTAGDAGALLDYMTTNIATSSETKYRLQIEIGGVTNGNRVEVEMDGAMLSVPTIDAQDVISTNIAFVAQGTDQLATTPNYDLTIPNELTVRYFSI